jgi:lysyl-tRNA synthetase class 2
MESPNDPNDLMQQRIQKVKELRAMGVVPFGRKFRVRDTTAALIERYGDLDGAALEERKVSCILAGRIMALRSFGKATFAHVQDAHGKLQIYAKKDHVGEEDYRLFQKLDVGDFIGVQGTLFRTKTDELTVEVDTYSLLTKALRPLPEKWHGLTDVETRYRQRYVDLIVNPEVRRTFLTRSRIITAIREFLDNRGFLEVETPMMQPIPGGATARPFVTRHNALGIPLYLRIAPELYLKRLIVGGFEKVYEINRNFRNEGISTIHNPEFTMLEFYTAYQDYRDLIPFTEEMLSTVAQKVTGTVRFAYQNHEIDLTPPWASLTLREAVLKYAGIPPDCLSARDKAFHWAREAGIPLQGGESLPRILQEIFEKKVEEKLVQPTFVTEYPTETSPLAMRKATDPEVTERFELFMAGREMANAFTELNDPEDQRRRFLAQEELKAGGDEEAQSLDEDFLRALEYGMPPTAGEGIGIDRLVMILTGALSIRDVILFPQMKPER